MEKEEASEAAALKFPFVNSEIKIKRAIRHIGELEIDIDKILNENPPTATASIIGEYPNVSIEYHIIMPGFPAELGALVGDPIHNLRAALDLGACDLVRAAGRSDKGVYFPFANELSDLPAQIKQKKFHRAGADAEALLHQLAPYRGGNLLLRAIHDLDIYDKHHALILAGIVVGGPVVRMWDDDGTPIPRIMGDATQPTQIIVVFPKDTGLFTWNVVQTLHEAVKLVQGIIEAFRALANRDAGL